MSFEIQICLAFLAAEIIFGASDESFECFLPSSPSPSHPFEGCHWHSQFPALLLSEFFMGECWNEGMNCDFPGSMSL